MNKFLTIFLCLILSGCASSLQKETPRMFYQVDKILTIAQVDSICKSDSIMDWGSIEFRESEGNLVKEYFHQKQDGTLYRVILVGKDSVEFKKRVVK